MRRWKKGRDQESTAKVALGAPPGPTRFPQEEVLEYKFPFAARKWTVASAAHYRLVGRSRSSLDFGDVMKRSAVRTSKGIERTRPASSHVRPQAIVINDMPSSEEPQSVTPLSHPIITARTHPLTAPGPFTPIFHEKRRSGSLHSHPKLLTRSRRFEEQAVKLDAEPILSNEVGVTLLAASTRRTFRRS